MNVFTKGFHPNPLHVFLLLVGLMLSACTVGQSAIQEAVTRERAMDTKDGRSSIFICRSSYGRLVSYDLVVNGEFLGKINSQTYYDLEVVPGTYLIEYKSQFGKLMASINLTVGENEKIYVFDQSEIKTLIVVTQFKLHLLEKSPEEGRERLQRCTLEKKVTI